MVNRVIIIASIAIALLTVGCATTKVQYAVNNTEDMDGKIKFNLVRSLIKVDLSKCGKDDAACNQKAQAISIPTEDEVSKYSMTPHDTIFLKTHIKATYIDNTRILSSIGAELEDNRIKVIQAAGAGLTAMAPIVTLAGTPLDPKLPVVIDVAEYVKNACGQQPCKWLPLPNNETKWCYKVEVGDMPPDAVDTAKFMKKFAETESDVMIYSACRDATVSISKLNTGEKCETKQVQVFNDKDDFVAKVKIADPAKVQTIKFPKKGKIDMHSSCGANLTDEKTDSTDTIAVLGELLKQAKTIKEAQDKKK